MTGDSEMRGPARGMNGLVNAVSLPDPGDVAKLTALLDLMRGWPSNEQRARFLLSSNWLRDRGGPAGQRITDCLAEPAEK